MGREASGESSAIVASLGVTPLIEGVVAISSQSNPTLDGILQVKIVLRSERRLLRLLAPANSLAGGVIVEDLLCRCRVEVISGHQSHVWCATLKVGAAALLERNVAWQ